jgi:hypothetical protein
MESIQLFFKGPRKGELVFGTAPRNKKHAEYLDKDFDYIYNLKNTPSADWYFKKIDDFDPKRFIHMKTGFDTKTGVFKLASKIARHVSKGARVFIHGKSLEDASGAVALSALYMLRTEKDFDPVKFVRQKGHFSIAVERNVRDLIKHVKEKSQNTMFWFQQCQKKNNEKEI